MTAGRGGVRSEPDEPDIAGQILDREEARMRCVAVVLDVLAAIAGLVGAWYWLCASRVVVENPLYPPSGIPPAPDVEQEGWVLGTLQAFTAAGRLNAIAARWTAVAVFLGAAGTLVGAWPF